MRRTACASPVNNVHLTLPPPNAPLLGRVTETVPPTGIAANPDAVPQY